MAKNKRRGGLLKGDRHSDPSGGIKAVVVTDNNRPVMLEDGEAILNREAVKKFWRQLSEMNQVTGGAPIKKPVGAVAENGGTITTNDINGNLRGEQILHEPKYFNSSNENNSGGYSEKRERKKVLQKQQANKRTFGLGKGKILEPQTKMQNGGVIGKKNLIYIGEHGGSNLNALNSPFWFENPFDNKKRLEIADDKIELKIKIDSLIENTKKYGPIILPLQEVVFHKELFEAYSEFKNIPVNFVYDDSGFCVVRHSKKENVLLIIFNLKKFEHEYSANDALSGDDGGGSESNDANGRNDPGGNRRNDGVSERTFERAKRILFSILIHELQHIVQIRENFSRGSSPLRERDRILRERGFEPGTASENERGAALADGQVEYRLSAGEIEANDIRKRIWLTKAERAYFAPFYGIQITDLKGVRAEFPEGLNWKTINNKILPSEKVKSTLRPIYFKDEILEKGGTIVKPMPASAIHKPHNIVGADQTTRVQSVIMDKEKFTKREAIRWAKKHKLKSEADEGVTVWRFRQHEPSEFQKGTFKSKKIKPGINLLLAKPKE